MAPRKDAGRILSTEKYMTVVVGSVRCVCKMVEKHVWDRGIAALGDRYHRVGSVDDPALLNADCFLQFNILNPYRENRRDRVAAYRYIINSGKPYLVWEEGNFRQIPQYKKFGWWSYLRSGRFNNTIVDVDRWQKIQRNTGIAVEPWAKHGDEIVIMGQLDGDSALMSLYDLGYFTFQQWVEEAIESIRQNSDRTICIRPHPLDKRSYLKNESELRKKYKNVYVSQNYSSTTTLNGGSGLQQDLDKAWCVITYTSNSAIEAVCKGVPVFAMSVESAAWDVAHHSFDDVENLSYSKDVDQWLHQIAYTIWTAEEISKGETWAHLKPVYFN